MIVQISSKSENQPTTFVSLAVLLASYAQFFVPLLRLTKGSFEFLD